VSQFRMVVLGFIITQFALRNSIWFARAASTSCVEDGVVGWMMAETSGCEGRSWRRGRGAEIIASVAGATVILRLGKPSLEAAFV